MNLGQIYETVLGWAGQNLGMKFATPIFDGASLDEITALTNKAGVPECGVSCCTMEEQVRSLTSQQQLV